MRLRRSDFIFGLTAFRKQAEAPIPQPGQCETDKCVDRRQRARGDDIALDWLEGLGAADMQDNFGIRLPRRLSEKSRLALIGFDKVQAQSAEYRQYESRKPGPGAEVDDGCTRRNVSVQLGAVPEMPAPRIVQTASPDQIERGLPARQNFEIGFKPRQCFT